jgi:hypothetical protein
MMGSIRANFGSLSIFVKLGKINNRAVGAQKKITRLSKAEAKEQWRANCSCCSGESGGYLAHEQRRRGIVTEFGTRRKFFKSEHSSTLHTKISCFYPVGLTRHSGRLMRMSAN